MEPKEQLPIGRAALAKIFCADWMTQHGKTILFSFLICSVLIFSLFQMTSKFFLKTKTDAYAKFDLINSQELTSPYYARFSQNTLTISQGKYAQALEEAKSLKTDLEKDDAFWEGRDKFVRSGTILYAYNLLRIATLEKELGSKEGELKAWEELVQHAGWKGEPVNMKMYDPDAYALLKQNFSQGDVSLLDYIEQ